MSSSLRLQFQVGLTLLVVLSTTVIGTLSYRTLSRTQHESALRLVSLAADSREELLLRSLHGAENRATTLLSRGPDICEEPTRALTRDCLQNMLDEYVETEGAIAARLVYGQGAALISGPERGIVQHPLSAADRTLLAQIGHQGKQVYFRVSSEQAGKNPGELDVFYDFKGLRPIFEEPRELGKTGETLLVAPDGTFIIHPRFALGGEVRARQSQALRLCLSGHDGEILTDDYRGVPAIHAYRAIEEVGGGCVMADIDAAQAFAPVARLRSHLLVVALSFIAVALAISYWLVNQVMGPIGRLEQRARALEEGDLASPVPIEGPLEIRTFAQTFAAMAASMRDMLQSREDLISIVSHDLRNPLTSIRLNADLLRRTRSEDRGAAEQISRSVRRMDELIGNLLDLSRIQGGAEIPIEAADEDLGTLLGETAELFRLMFERAKVTLELSVPPEPVLARVDRARMAQVLSNLIGNALKFTPQGGRVRVSLERAGEEARISVSDTGPGIPPKDLDHVFDRYWQAQGTAKKGTGLGLYIARAIVRAHGGRIWAESAPGEGATFVFSVPLSPVAPSPPEAAAHS